MTQIETYAVNLVVAGARSHAEDDIDEDREFTDRADWLAARDLALEMAQVIERDPAIFLRWYLNEATL